MWARRCVRLDVCAQTCAHIRVQVDVCTHSHLHVHVHACTLVHMYAWIFVAHKLWARAPADTHVHMYTLAYAHGFMQVHTHANVHVYNTCLYVRAHMHTRACKHSRTHACAHMPSHHKKVRLVDNTLGRVSLHTHFGKLLFLATGNQLILV